MTVAVLRLMGDDAAVLRRVLEDISAVSTRCTLEGPTRHTSMTSNQSLIFFFHHAPYPTRMHSQLVSANASFAECTLSEVHDARDIRGVPEV